MLFRKPRNLEQRTREYLRSDEIDRMLVAAKANGKYGHRDYTLILIAYRHGLRVTEICELEWSQINFGEASIHVCRKKGGTESTHPLRTVELRALKKLQQGYKRPVPNVFWSHRDAPLAPSNVHRIIVRAGVEAGLNFPVHAHMLRHACGYYLANKGEDTRAIQAYLGHKDIKHTVRYTDLAPQRFKDFWRD